MVLEGDIVQFCRWVQYKGESTSRENQQLSDDLRHHSIFCPFTPTAPPPLSPSSQSREAVTTSAYQSAPASAPAYLRLGVGIPHLDDLLLPPRHRLPGLHELLFQQRGGSFGCIDPLRQLEFEQCLLRSEAHTTPRTQRDHRRTSWHHYARRLEEAVLATWTSQTSRASRHITRASALTLQQGVNAAMGAIRLSLSLPLSLSLSLSITLSLASPKI